MPSSNTAPDVTRAQGPAAAEHTPLSGALYMATAHDVPVFPLRPGTKQPYAGEGIGVATTDMLQVIAWATERPGCNFGAATAGLAVIDIDIKHGGKGFESLDALCKEHGRLPNTLQVASPSGGQHIVLRGENVGQACIGPNIDVRGVGGYVVCIGSEVGGKAYRLMLDAPVADVPETWRRLFSRPKQRKESDKRDVAVVEWDTEEAIARAKAFLESRPGVDEGGRNNTLYPTIAQLRDFGVSQDLAGELAEEFWGRRCSPGIDLEECKSTAYNVYRYAQNERPGNLHSESDFRDVAAALDAADQGGETAALAELLDDIPEKPPAVAAEPEAVNPDEQFEVWDTDFADSDLVPRPWLMVDMLMRGQITALLAHPGVGKSSLSLAITVSAALGNGDRVGFAVPKKVGPIKVVLLTVEESRDELNARLWAYCKHHGIDRAALAGRIYVQRVTSDAFALIRANKVTRNREVTAAYKRLAKLVAREKIDAIVFDPFVELHDADENDNNAIADVIKAIRALCRHYDAAGLVVHHTRKGSANGGTAAGDMHSARGAGSFIGAVRIAHTLTYPTDEDAERYAMGAAERASLIRLDNAKANYGKRGADHKWFQFSSVKMPFAADEEDGQYTGVLSLVDLRGRQDAELRAVFAVLRDDLLSAGPNGLAIEYAAKICITNDRITFGTQPAAAAKRLRRLFGRAPQECGGERITLEGTGKKASLRIEELDAEDFAE